MTKSLISVGYAFPGGLADDINLASDRTLLDADIVLFETGLGDYSYADLYQGKPSPNENASFQVRERLAHWHYELKAAYDAGKTIFVFLAKPDEAFLDTGRRERSGTGRNQKVTRIVEPTTSYSALPFRISVQARTGSETAPAGDLGYLATYWSEFGELSPFEVTISGDLSRVLLKTRSGNAIVAGLIHAANGTFVLLPPLRYDPETFVTYNEEAEESQWTEEAIQFGNRLLGSLIEIDRAIRAETSITPAPDWVRSDDCRLPGERELQGEIQKRTDDIGTLQEEKATLEDQLRDAGVLRNLLYERGKPLEEAVLEALRLLGFDVSTFCDDESEFDAVFISPEGRFLGEVEGKDRKAINIEKLQQLERNVQEDFARDDVKDYARGVLFGNAFRLQSLAERENPFTEKCVSGARRSGTVLVATSDLFEPSRYLLKQQDPDYAATCRTAIADAAGSRASFPHPPTKDSDI